MNPDGGVLTGPDNVLEVSLVPPHGPPTVSDAALHRITAALDRAEADPACRMLVLHGASGVFCTGLDLGETYAEGEAGPRASAELFFGVLSRFTRSPVLVVTVVDGRATGGGVGLVAASDVAVATARAQFALPELRWGLLPCSVLPFLIRRTGFQTAYAMTLTGRSLTAPAAERAGLVNEVSANPQASVRRLAEGIGRTRPSAVGDVKRYVGALHAIPAHAEALAVAELSRLMSSSEFLVAVDEFTSTGRYPWE